MISNAVQLRILFLTYIILNCFHFSLFAKINPATGTFTFWSGCVFFYMEIFFYRAEGTVLLKDFYKPYSINKEISII